MNDYETEAERVNLEEIPCEVEPELDTRSIERVLGKVQEQKRQYRANKSAGVGKTITCVWCGRQLTKRTPTQAFCRKRGPGKKQNKGNLCRQQFWNRVRYWESR